MKVSTKCRYGLRAMIYLAKKNSQSPVKRKDISKAEKIPQSYLENILLLLRKSGLVTTTRGASGGFVLAKPPDKIRLSEIVEMLEGPMAPVQCILQPGTCERSKACEAQTFWDRLYREEKKILDSTTLHDLINTRKDEWVI